MSNHSYYSKTINYNLSDKSDEVVKQIRQKISELLGLLDQKNIKKFANFRKHLSSVELSITKSVGSMTSESWEIKFKNKQPFDRIWDTQEKLS